MEAKVTRLFLCLSAVAVLFLGCLDNQAFPDVGQIAVDEERGLTGVFDLKSICLNAGPKNVVSDPYCLAYLSENSWPNPKAVAVQLRVCTEQDSTNCIERLHENAPPETITIRNFAGYPISGWGRNRVQLRNLGGAKPVFEVLTIY